MSVAKMPRLSNNLSSNGTVDTNGNGKQTDNVEEWEPEDGTRWSKWDLIAAGSIILDFIVNFF